MTLYDILGLPRDATPGEIRAAYRALAKQYHPDLVQQADGDTRKLAEERLKAINEAYTTLSDPIAREKYHQVMWTSRDPARKYQKIFPPRRTAPSANGKGRGEKATDPAAHILIQLQAIRSDQEFMAQRQYVKRRRFMGGALLSTLIIFFFMWMENVALSTTTYDLIPRLGSFLFTFLCSELIALPIIVNASAMRIPRYPGISSPVGFSLAVFVGSTLGCTAIVAPRTLNPIASSAFVAGGLTISLALLVHVYFIRRLSHLQEILFMEEQDDLKKRIRLLERQLNEIRQKES